MTRNVFRSITVNATPERAYAVWSDFENYPLFMGPIVRVRREGRQLSWRAVFDGHTDEWEAEVAELSPYRRIAWHATSGRHHHVVVTIRPLDDSQTEVTIGAEYIADPKQHQRRALRYEEYLRAFKEVVESPSAGVLMTPMPQSRGEFT